MITVLDEAFPKNTFLMNGIIQGIKGFLSFLSAPLIGSMSDIFGRKPFLFLTVTFTCSPIPLIKLSHWWYFTMISISGIFSVTFSVVLAFVSDVTTVEDRSWAYGLVSATFAASLIISPALGAFLEKAYSENLVISLATAIALLDILFIMVCVPESLGFRSSAGTGSSSRITWENVDPFGGLRRMTNDRLTLIVCMTTFLSYLPETGEYSCFFVYLRLVSAVRSFSFVKIDRFNRHRRWHTDTLISLTFIIARSTVDTLEVLFQLMLDLLAPPTDLLGGKLCGHSTSHWFHGSFFNEQHFLHFKVDICVWFYSSQVRIPRSWTYVLDTLIPCFFYQCRTPCKHNF
ncbi:unnamed protein product [Schistocephalus solidus]|uniref:Hippocampus abundant transcript 1 protein n=1 Tax=Schistocephalus solidus TaxID=70667 RepID=A0A183TID5_SCHSO|nr:unnamed protein product [Schistocephalus solidus]